MRRRPFLIFSVLISSLFIMGCKKKGMGDSCKNNKECGNGSDTCMTIEGENVCTKLCAKDNDCPSGFKCVKILVKHGHAITTVPSYYCIDKKFDKKLVKKGQKRVDNERRAKYKKYKSEKGEAISAAQSKKLTAFLKKYRMPIAGAKKPVLGITYAASYSSLGLKNQEKSFKKLNKKFKDVVAWRFIPIPWEDYKSNRIIVMGMEILYEKGYEQYWKFHKKVIKRWSTANRSSTLFSISKTFGYSKKQVLKITSMKKWKNFIAQLTDIVEGLDLEKKTQIITPNTIFKGNIFNNDLETIAFGLYLENKDRQKTDSKTKKQNHLLKQKNSKKSSAKQTPMKKSK